MQIAVITALPEESRAIRKRGVLIEDSPLGGRTATYCRIAGHDVTLVEAGIGMLNAGWAATMLAEKSPDLLVSVGFGGGILPGLAVGDVVVAEKVLHWTGNIFEQVEAGYYALNITGSQAPLRGEFITSDEILDKKKLAELLPQNICRPVADMESAAVARVALERGIPFMGVRVVSDTWDEELGFSISEFCDESKHIRIKSVAATILKRPAIIFQLA
ncbi:MAG: hypothetical protein WCP33_06055, partial [Deltaproteobacteria bacterium]